MVIDSSVVVAILAALPLMGIFQLIKGALSTSGLADYLIAAVISFGGVAVWYLLITPPFALVPFLVYGALVFGEVSGLFHITAVAMKSARKAGRPY